MTRANYSTFDNNEIPEERATALEFEDVLKVVGANGKYQKVLLYGILTPLFFMAPILANTVIFLLFEPDHHCQVQGEKGKPFPGTFTSFWDSTLPREIGPNGAERYSQCKMYGRNKSVVACPSGYEYDQSDYSLTIVSQYDWVCDREDYATIVYTVEAIAGALGTLVFGCIGDRYGRKSCFLLCCFMMSLFLTLRLFAAAYFPLFLLCSFLSRCTFPMIYISLYAIAVELTDSVSRTWIYGFTTIIWVVGLSVLALLAWLSRYWLVLGLSTSLPGFVLLLFYKKYIPESPRWLIRRNQIEEAAELMLTMAKVNGRLHKVNKGKMTEMLLQVKALQDEQEAGKPKRSVLSLFSSWQIGLNTVLLSVTWSANALVYYAITLLTTSIAGNQFLNFFLLSIVELPSAYIAGVTSGSVGRRWTQTFSFFLGGASLVVSVFATLDASRYILFIISLMICRLCMTASNLIVTLQASEVFPTDLRSTGSGLACGVAYFAAVAAPAVAYLVKLDIIMPYIVMCVMCFIGTFSSVFLPETLNQTLPETVEDAKALGHKVPFWSFLPPDYKASMRNSALLLPRASSTGLGLHGQK